MDIFIVNGKAYIGLEAARAAAVKSAVEADDFVGIYSLVCDDEGRPQGVHLYSVGPEGEVEDTDDSEPEYDYTSVRMG